MGRDHCELGMLRHDDCDMHIKLSVAKQIFVGAQATLDSYEAMPIEAFGEAMMRGMGWSEGLPVGRNSNAKVCYFLSMAVGCIA